MLSCMKNVHVFRVRSAEAPSIALHATKTTAGKSMDVISMRVRVRELRRRETGPDYAQRDF